LIHKKPIMPNEVKVITRPWGHYREYARNQPCTVWLVEMKPGESGSLQSHEHFDERWTLLDDGAIVQIGDDILHPRAFDEVYIPRGTRHRLSNEHGTRPIRMFEVAYGPVNDDDKIRYEDKYGRARS
jgi:mannose-6-phosphate isomerase